jgi:hypothetical protein
MFGLTYHYDNGVKNLCTFLLAPSMKNDNLRGIYTGNVGLAISLSVVISIPRSIDFKWYIHFKSIPRR